MIDDQLPARVPGSADAPEADRSRSAWSAQSKIARVLWMIVQATAFRWSFHNWYAWRRWLLRCFGARVGERVRVRPTARIEIPWHLQIGDDSSVGDFAILYSLGRITIGRMTTVSQYSHLCAGTHDYSRRNFPLVTLPIRIGDDVWIAADAFVGPGVTVGTHAIVSARATVIYDVDPSHIVAGNPARYMMERPPYTD